MNKTKRPLSFVLAVLMIVSMFAAAPFTASAVEEQMESFNLGNYKYSDEDDPDWWYAAAATGTNVTLSPGSSLSAQRGGWYVGKTATRRINIKITNGTVIRKIVATETTYNNPVSIDAGGKTIAGVKANGKITFDRVNAAEATLYTPNSGTIITQLDVYYGDPVPSTYTVTWKNWDGTVLETDTDVADGATPEYNSAAPTRADDDTYTYTFAGWDKELTAVTEDVTYTATYTQTEKSLDQQFVTIDDQVSITLAVDLGARGKTTDDVSVTVAGNAYDAEAVDAGEGVYKYKIEMAPAQIADEIVVSFDENPDNNLTTSIKDYCDTLCTNAAYQAAEYADARALAKATLEYGKAANTVFAYTDAASFAGIGDPDKTTVNAYTGAVFTDGTKKVTGASFMALTKPEFRFYTSGITESQGYDYNQAGVTATMDGGSDALTARFVKKADGTTVLLEVTGVTAENMDKTITVTVTGLGTITFNGNAFAKAMAKSSNAAQQNLGAALYNYGVAANACFGA